MLVRGFDSDMIEAIGNTYVTRSRDCDFSFHLRVITSITPRPPTLLPSTKFSEPIFTKKEKVNQITVAKKVLIYWELGLHSHFACWDYIGTII